MTREEAKELLPIIQAYVEGKTIQIWDEDNEMWLDLNEPSFSRLIKYRAKPQTPAHYRPFKDTQECWEEMQKHQPFGWLKDKDEDDYFTLEISERLDYKDKLGMYTFADGEPFGIREE